MLLQIPNQKTHHVLRTNDITNQSLREPMQRAGSAKRDEQSYKQNVTLTSTNSTSSSIFSPSPSPCPAERTVEDDDSRHAALPPRSSFSRLCYFRPYRPDNIERQCAHSEAAYKSKNRENTTIPRRHHRRYITLAVTRCSPPSEPQNHGNTLIRGEESRQNGLPPQHLHNCGLISPILNRISLPIFPSGWTAYDVVRLSMTDLQRHRVYGLLAGC